MKQNWLAPVLALAVAGGARAEPLELSDEVSAHVRGIHARKPGLRDDVFSKMGGSSVASKAFLHCFAAPYVELGEHEALAETLAYFGNAQRNSFNRESQAAGVSWNLRYVLGGRPASFREELEATQARWALVLFGGNDAQNENERVYLKRLVYLVEALEAMGVVPILGSALPRRNSLKERWIRRFNAITEAVATHWSLPFIDYHGALSALPRKGLARDGVHPNVLGRGGAQAACQLTEEGLRYGNNLRNLLTLEMLDALRRAVEGGDSDSGRDTGVVADAGTGTDAGIGTDAGTGTDAFPFSALVTKSSLPLAGTLPKHCGVLRPSSRLYRHRLALSARTRLRASAFDIDGYKHRVLWVRVDEKGERCVRRRTQTLEVDARPGMWDLIVEAPARAAEQGQMLILITRNPR